MNADEVKIVSGSEEEERFVVLFRRGDRLTAACGLSSAGRIAKYRRLLEEQPLWAEHCGSGVASFGALTMATGGAAA